MDGQGSPVIMTENDRIRFGRALAACATILKGAPSSEAVDLYFRLLNELSIEEVERAIYKCMKTLVFFPAPAQILEAAEGARSAEQPRWLPPPERSDAEKQVARCEARENLKALRGKIGSGGELKRFP